MEGEWAEFESTMEEIRKTQPRDRLEYASSCAKMAVLIHNSVTGWLEQLSNPEILNTFDKRTLKRFFEFYQRFTLDLLEFDVNATLRE
ncbi:MAG: hypothetical protein ACE5KO_01560 [Candidatus Bathyarchaeia archaeon]